MSKPAPSPGSPETFQARSLLMLALLACFTGMLSGLVAALFRLALQQSDRWRDAVIGWAHGWPVAGFLFVAGGVATATAIAAWLVRRFAPYASGSGIPHVEAVVNGELPPAPFQLLPVKFFAGWLAIGGGLALGREGPSVQMGASVGSLLGKAFQLDRPDGVALLAAGAGAVFVLEELVRRFDTRIAIAALGASGGAIGVARLLLGDSPDFKVEAIAPPGLGTGFLFFAFGAAAGLAGVAYNRAILGALAVTDRLGKWPVELRAAMIGAAVGGLAWFAPALVGGGDPLTQRALAGGEGLALVSLLLGTRFVLGAVSYSAITPGGLFAPMLVLGAQLGLLFGGLCHLGFGDLATPPLAFVVVGMAAFFTAVVRAPVTGIVLVAELTGNHTLLLPMLAACFAAMLVPTLLRNRPIYDSLKARTLWLSRTGE